MIKTYICAATYKIIMFRVSMHCIFNIITAWWETWRFGEFLKVVKLKIANLTCMPMTLNIYLNCTIPNESHFTKFNACQSYPLQSHLTLCISHVDSETQQYCHLKHNKILHFCIILSSSYNKFNMEWYTCKKKII